ncbi:MAG: efflux RND transporter periplasmic adaptor subunit [Oxalobacter sp.]|nr:efflux RND transporter periplasmic adaptor subunit [Oxalobacter sp.]
MNVYPCLKGVGIVLTAAAVLTACGQKPQPPARMPEVSYIVIGAERLTIENELPGRLESFRTADIRARVPGVVLKRCFEEGSIVKKGQVLFRIDPRDYQASIQSAQATLAHAEANKIQADLKLKRYKPLVGIDAISKQEYDDAIAASKQAAADVQAGRAALAKAKLNLEYANVISPITGRIGRALVTEGALVGQNEPTLLATVQQIDPMYLNLTRSSTELIKMHQQLLNGSLQNPGNSIPVTMKLEDGTEYTEKGSLVFSDITVDPSSGEVTVRALFPNPKGLLLPGTFVRAKFEQAIRENAIVVPQQAVLHTNEGDSVMVLNSEDVVETRKIVTGGIQGTRFIVTEGLEPGDKVIVEGLQKVKPGIKVKAVPWEDPEKKDTPEQIQGVAPVEKTEKAEEKQPQAAAKN